MASTATDALRVTLGADKRAYPVTESAEQADELGLAKCGNKNAAAMCGRVPAALVQPRWIKGDVLRADAECENGYPDDRFASHDTRRTRRQVNADESDRQTRQRGHIGGQESFVV